MRTLYSVPEFVEAITGMSGKKFVTVGYISGANLNIPMEKRKNPETNRMKNYHNMVELGQGLGQEGAIGGVLKFTSYNLQFANADEMNRAYDDYSMENDIIRNEFGLEGRKQSGGYQERNDYGAGVKTYSGLKPELMGSSYMNLNTVNARKSSTYYIIGADGGVITPEGMDEESVKSMFGKYGKPEKVVSDNPEIQGMMKQLRYSDSGYTQLKKMEAEDSRIIEYLKKILSLKMNYQTFKFSSIVYMVGTCSGEKFLFINNDLTKTISDVECEINPQEFIEIAKRRYEGSFNELNQMASGMNESRRWVVYKISEAELRGMVMESVARVLSESDEGDSLAYRIQRDPSYWG